MALRRTRTPLYGLLLGVFLAVAGLAAPTGATAAENGTWGSSPPPPRARR